MPKIRVVPRTKQQLVAMAVPESANQPEALPWYIYDTQTYVSGTTVRLQFFQNVNVNKALSNVEGGGQFPDPQFFEIHYFALDIKQQVQSLGALTAAGPLDDVQQLVLNSGGYFKFEQSNKIYGPFPLTVLHCTGGVTGFGWGTFVAPQSKEYANNGVMDGGMCVAGAVVIPPKVNYSITMEWPTALTLTGDTALRMSMFGVLHRRVL